MQWIDWTIVAGFIVFLAIVVQTTRKYNRSVADFLAANRCGGRYIVGTADGMAGMGAITIVSAFENYYAAGLAPIYWGALVIPLMLFLRMSGFIIYRFRSTRAFTMGQFFEMRYSRRFRVFAGFLAWLAGIVNFGVFPAVGAGFFVTFSGLPETFHMAGIEISSFSFVLLILVALVIYFTLTGGQISILVTDFWQAILSLFAFIMIIVFLFYEFSWETIEAGLIAVSEPGRSKINPFDIGREENFNFIFYCIFWFTLVYKYEAWHGNQGYEAAAISPHEQKMAQVSGYMRGFMIEVCLIIIPLCALALMNLPEYANQAAQVNQVLDSQFLSDSQVDLQGKRRMSVPAALTHILPVGLVGAFAAAMVGFLISTHNTYMHAWGVILIQDVVMPLRGKPFSPKRHMQMLRLSIIGVAIFVFFFSLYFQIQEFITFYFMLTGAIYLGGAGATIIGGLYWKRATTAGAWAAMIGGSGVAIPAVIIQQVWEHWPYIQAFTGSRAFPLSGHEISFIAAMTAILLFIIVSLLTKKPDLNFDKLFHRDKYSIKDEMRYEESQRFGKIPFLWRLIGVNSNEFNALDKFMYAFVFFQAALVVVSFFALIILNSLGAIDTSGWLHYWYYYIVVSLVFGTIGALWVSIGGFSDLIRLYRGLREKERDDADDGFVEGQTSISELSEEEKCKVME